MRFGAELLSPFQQENRFFSTWICFASPSFDFSEGGWVGGCVCVRERERERESAGKRERARKEEEVNEMVGGRVYQRRCREGAGGFKIIGWEVKGF